MPSAVRTIALASAFVCCSSCNAPDPGREILDQAFAAHGAEILASATLEFEFRGDQFSARRARGLFRYERVYHDSTGIVHDFVTNAGSFREINGEPQSVDDAMAYSILDKVNSVVYFASLPYPLRDPAVNPRYLGRGTVDGTEYRKVEVTFRRAGGGPDYQDRFVYWVNSETDLIDYMAYYYLTNDTGSRFRHFVNPRIVGGFRVVDHVNFTASPDTIGDRIERFDELFEQGAVEVVSEVKHESVRVVPVDPTDPELDI